MTTVVVPAAVDDDLGVEHLFRERSATAWGSENDDAPGPRVVTTATLELAAAGAPAGAQLTATPPPGVTATSGAAAATSVPLSVVSTNTSWAVVGGRVHLADELTDLLPHGRDRSGCVDHGAQIR